MTNRRRYTPYRIPTAWNGDRLIPATHKWDASLLQAAQEIAKGESERWGSVHGVLPILMNFLLNDRDPEIAKAKRAFKRRYRELKQQEKREHAYQDKAIKEEFN